MKPANSEQRTATQLILALDVDNPREALRWVKLLYPKVKIFKVGLELYTAGGPKIIRAIRKTGASVFLDLKFNDIPNTMAKAAKEALKHKAAMFTVHTLSGPTALKEVSNICRGSHTKVLGVTLLTSICGRFLKDLGINKPVSSEVLYLARMARRCGLDGVVCSVQEARIIRKRLGRNFIILTPGIRPDGFIKEDQKRIATPKDAREAGADFIVVGRPILKAKNPRQVVEEILTG
ncbi:MAG: orotidine-5'-phosphate decarboxylase [Candidatus Omnitrophica bacterium]|nr:orotidine-5'-phosphate decarboxylase [Candidatus Omnitrophota bacterium]MDD5592508.1 orotidine-5'-phosphate decarboxylase [Candidatus Omnitrophota bacterium]